MQDDAHTRRRTRASTNRDSAKRREPGSGFLDGLRELDGMFEDISLMVHSRPREDRVHLLKRLTPKVRSAARALRVKRRWRVFWCGAC